MELESAAAFRAFTCYQDMDPGERNVAGAYRIYKGADANDIEAHPGPPGSFRAWAKTFEWKDRVEAYDLFILEQARLRAEDAHIDRLVDFRDRMLNYSKQASAAALSLMEKLAPIIKALDGAALEPKNLERLTRMTTQLMESAVGTEAQALAVEEIMVALDDSNKLI